MIKELAKEELGDDKLLSFSSQNFRFHKETFGFRKRPSTLFKVSQTDKYEDIVFELGIFFKMIQAENRAKSLSSLTKMLSSTEN
jgi:hypothetical protein